MASLEGEPTAVHRIPGLSIVELEDWPAVLIADAFDPCGEAAPGRGTRRLWGSMSLLVPNQAGCCRPASSLLQVSRSPLQAARTRRTGRELAAGQDVLN